MGSLMAMEVIREIVGFGESLVGRLLMVDARSMRFDTFRYGWDEGNPLSGAQQSSSRTERSGDPGSSGKFEDG
jgi:adenylyltransferase/sulfurtransferase